MIRKVQFKEILIEKIIERQERRWKRQGEFMDVNENLAACLRVNPSIDTVLIQKIKTIKGVGWVNDGADYAAIFKVSPKKILLESGCPGTWCKEHMGWLVYEIVELLKQDGEVNYKGPSLPSPPYSTYLNL